MWIVSSAIAWETELDIAVGRQARRSPSRFLIKCLCANFHNIPEKDLEYCEICKKYIPNALTPKRVENYSK